MKSDKPDYFELHPEELKDGAKLVVARLVQNRVQSIRVPQIFNTVEAAIISGKDVVIRSDHPGEYNGLEGVLNSEFARRTKRGLTFNLLENGRFNEYSISSSEELDRYARRIVKSWGRLESFLKISVLDEDGLLRDLKFSLWETISRGMNGAMWADPVIEGKYHFAVLYEQDDHVSQGYYSINTRDASYSKGRPIKKIEGNIPGRIKNIIQLIEAYEEIRGLNEFNNNHCYDMEFQISPQGNIYFLQLRRLRDFSSRSFVLDRKPEKGEFETDGVIGSTIEEGETYLTRQVRYFGGI